MVLDVAGGFAGLVTHIFLVPGTGLRIGAEGLLVAERGAFELVCFDCTLETLADAALVLFDLGRVAATTGRVGVIDIFDVAGSVDTFDRDLVT